MVSRISIKRVVPLASITVLFAGCLELATTPPIDGEGSSTGTSASSSVSSSASSSSSGSGGFGGSGGSMSSSSSSVVSSSSSMTTASSSSSSSASSSSSGQPYELMVVSKSNFGTTIQNDSQGVLCAVDTLTLPDGTMGDALHCTHVAQMAGSFFQGLTVNLEADIPYVFSFFFRNNTFDSPYSKFPPEIGIKMTAPNGSGGGQLHTFDSYPNGWYRQRYMFTPSTAGSFQIGFMHSLDRPPGGAYWLYGFQIETGTNVTPYVP